MLNSIFFFEPMTGIEPVTSSLPRKRSTPELHRRLDCTQHRLLFAQLELLTLNLKYHYDNDKIAAFKTLSERPGSNRRHSAWKADALPTELLSHSFLIQSLNLSGLSHKMR